LHTAGLKIRKKGKLYGETIKNLLEIDINNIFEKEFVPDEDCGDKNENIRLLK